MKCSCEPGTFQPVQMFARFSEAAPQQSGCGHTVCAGCALEEACAAARAGRPPQCPLCEVEVLECKVVKKPGTTRQFQMPEPPDRTVPERVWDDFKQAPAEEEARGRFVILAAVATEDGDVRELVCRGGEDGEGLSRATIDVFLNLFALFYLHCLKPLARVQLRGPEFATPEGMEALEVAGDDQGQDADLQVHGVPGYLKQAAARGTVYLETMLALAGVVPGEADRRGRGLTPFQFAALFKRPGLAPAADLLHRICANNQLSPLQLWLGRSLENCMGITKPKWGMLRALRLVPTKDALGKLDQAGLGADTWRNLAETCFVLLAFDNIGFGKPAGPFTGPGWIQYVHRILYVITQEQLIEDGILKLSEEDPARVMPAHSHVRNEADGPVVMVAMVLNNFDPKTTRGRLGQRIGALFSSGLTPAAIGERLAHGGAEEVPAVLLPVKLTDATGVLGVQAAAAAAAATAATRSPHSPGLLAVPTRNDNVLLEAIGDAEPASRQQRDRYKNAIGVIPLRMDLASLAANKVLAEWAQEIRRDVLKEAQDQRRADERPFRLMDAMPMPMLCDGGPAHLMRHKDIDTENQLVCNGGFHTVLECIRLHSRLFEQTHLRYFYGLYRTPGQVEYLLDLPNPNQWIQESPEYIYAHMAAARKHLEDQWATERRGQQPTDADLHAYMVARAEEMPAAALVLLDLHIREAIHGLLDAEINRDLGEYQACCALLMKYLVPLTNAFKYLELHLDHAAWWEKATDLQKAVYNKYCWVVETSAGNGRGIFTDRNFEHSVKDLRLFIGKDAFTGIDAKLARVATVLPEMVRARQAEAGRAPAAKPGRAASVAVSDVFMEVYGSSRDLHLWELGGALRTVSKTLTHGIGRSAKKVKANGCQPRHLPANWRQLGQQPVTILGEVLALGAGGLTKAAEERFSAFSTFHAQRAAGTGGAAARPSLQPLAILARHRQELADFAEKRRTTTSADDIAHASWGREKLFTVADIKEELRVRRPDTKFGAMNKMELAVKLAAARGEDFENNPPAPAPGAAAAAAWVQDPLLHPQRAAKPN